MAQAIRRKNITAVQLRRKDKKVRRYIRAAFNGTMGLLAFVGFFAIPMVLEAFGPDVQSVLNAARNLVP